MKANDQAAFPDICRFVPILVGKRTTAIKSSINAVKLLRITLAVVRVDESDDHKPHLSMGPFAA